MSLSLFGSGFTQLVVLKPTMPQKLIKSMLENAKDGTVFEFQSGKYKLLQDINLTTKSDIALRAREDVNVTLIDTVISFNKCKNIKIENLSLVSSSRVLLNEVDKFNINKMKVYNSGFDIRFKSQGSIKNSEFTADDTAKYNPIYIKSKSIVLLDSIKLNSSTKKLFAIYSENSSFELLNSNIVSIYSIGMHAIASNIFVHHNHFNGISTGKIGLHRAINLENKSQAYITENNFKNFFIDVLLFDSSIAQIYKNNFFHSSWGVVIQKKTESEILQNKFSGVNFPILLNNSKANISANQYKDYKVGIELRNYSAANIEKENFQDKNDKSIVIRSTSSANLKDIEYIKHTYCMAEKESKIYSFNKYRRINLPGIGDPQVQEKPIAISVKPVSFDTHIFGKIKLKEKLNIDFSLSDKLLKGYTTNSITFYNEEGEEEIIYKDTYIIFDSYTHKIIEPKEYRGVILKKTPSLTINQAQRKIIPKASIWLKNKKRYIVFYIISNIQIKKIIFDTKPIEMHYYTLNGYQTIKRRVRKDDLYPLILKNDDITLKYECRVIGTYVSCNAVKKDEL
jgi:hypothetical protein